MIKHKSTLAKLLAKENVTVQYGNYSTAWFDIKDRILGLPMWKDMGSDVSDLLIGHEVGHALFTPYEGWHDSPEKLQGCPRTYINVIEDARIERHIKDSYIGLVGPMARGYKKLFDDGFFGEEFTTMNWDKVKLIDKINLKAKVGAHLDVPLDDVEIEYYNRAMTTETFEEVLDLVRDVLAYTKENEEELIEKPEPQEDEPEVGDDENNKDEMTPQGHDDAEGDQPKETLSNESDETEVEDDAPQEKQNAQNPVDDDVAISDLNFRQREKNLLDIREDNTQTLIGNEFNKDVFNKIVIPYKDLAQQRKENSNKNQEHSEWLADLVNKQALGYKAYSKAVKKDVNYAVKEFEMRKAAFRYSRSQTAKTGSIDVNKVWSYKTNEDIFSRVTQLADSKNHGMVMIIDFSGSMCDVMNHVLDQLFHLVTFCKAVNIPFEVYGFTSCNTLLGGGYSWDGDTIDTSKQLDSEVYHQKLSMPQLVTSKLKKADFEEAMEHIFLRSSLSSEHYGERSIMSPNEEYGSTPLNEALIASHRIIDSFKKTHNVENMNFVVISDGDTNGTSICKKEIGVNRVKTHPSYSRHTEMNINIMGKSVKLAGNRREGTQSLLNNLAKRFNTTNIGFFIANDGSQFKSKIAETHGEYWLDDELQKEYNKEFNKKRCVTLKGLGYKELYILKSKNLSVETTDFNPAEEASKGQLTTAFKKFSKSKKLNKTLLTNFGKIVAE